MSALSKSIHPDEKYKAGTLGTSMSRAGFGLGAVLLIVSVVLGATAGDQWMRFFHAYLTAYTWVVSIALGGLFFVIIHHLTRARWSVVLRRVAECITDAFPVLFVLGLVIVVPVVLGYPNLYYWNHPDAHDAHLNHHLHGKLVWLNPGFFALRYAVYFLVWIGVSRYFARKSREQDETGNERLSEQMRIASGPAIIAYAMTLCFFAFDFLMSLAPKWYSTIYGVNFFGGSMIAIYAFLSVLGVGIQRSGRLTHSITTEHYHDTGKMLFAFTFFWAYTAFSQFMLYWYSNIPEETVWYNYRFFNDWQYVSLAVTLGQWAFPFLFLLSRWTKRIQPIFMFFCVWQLVFHYVDLYWNVMPNYHWTVQKAFNEGKDFVAGPLSGAVGANTIGLSPVDVLLPAALMLLFVGAIGRAMKGNLLPVKDPNLGASLAHENY